MICRYCGNTVDAETTVCPYCNSPLIGYNAPISYEEDPQEVEEGSFYEEAEEEYEETPKQKKGLKLPSLPTASFSLATVLSACSLLVSLICLFVVCSLRASFSSGVAPLNGSLSQLQSSLVTVQSRLDSMEDTIANVQNNAYTQLAAANITITKDITSLTGPVAINRYNQMFIVRAKGNLNAATAFDWQKYNASTGGWVSIVFTGNATTNEEYGLRLENKVEDGEFVSILWANGITKAAEGSYRCVITDNTGVKNHSSEAIVQVSDA